MSTVTVIGKHGAFWHGSITEAMLVKTRIGRASGSQEGRGWVADVTIKSASWGALGYGITVSNPDTLDAAAEALTEAATALRAMQAES